MNISSYGNRMYTLWHHMIQLQLSSNIECVEMYLHRLSQWAAEEVEGLTTISQQDNNVSSIATYDFENS